MIRSNKLRIAFVFGTRPEAIKMYPVILEVQKYPEWIEPIVVLTGQHKEMLDQMIHLFDIKPDYNLRIMKHGQSLSQISSQILMNLERIYHECNLDYVFVQGDTTTTFIGALAAFYQKIKIVHIEAGLRTDNKYSPYPEEINRRMTSVLSDYHFAPTERAANALIEEGVSKDQIYISGNTVIDSLFLMLKENYTFSDFRINQVLKENKKLILVTMHRRENWGKAMENLCLALKEILSKYKNLAVIFPMHKNPILRKVIMNHLSQFDNIYLSEPFDYREMTNVLNVSTLVLTDSGGIQEEAPALGKPVLVLREETERPEAIQSGCAKLVGTNPVNILQEVQNLLSDSEKYRQMVLKKSPFGDGFAAERIVRHLLFQSHFVEHSPKEFTPFTNK